MGLPNTKVALRDYIATQPKRDMLIDNALTDVAVKQWQQKEDEALNKVRRAFYKDTKDRNSLDNCMLLTLKTLRDWVEGPHDD